MRQSLLLSMLIVSGLYSTAQTWQSRVSGFSHTVTGSAIYAIDDQVAWATGIEWDGDGPTYLHTGISRTLNSGNGWESVQFPTAEKARLINISALDAMRAWMLVAMRPATTHEFYRLYNTADGGIIWDTQTIFLPTTPAFIHMWDESVGVVVSNPDPDGFRIRRTIDGGNTWTPVSGLPPALFDEYVVSNLFETRDNQLWAATALGRTLHSPDRGLTWNVIDSPLNDHPPVSMAISETNQLYMVFYDSLAVYGDTRIFRKSLPGGPWVNISESNSAYYPYSLEAVPGSGVLVFTTHDGINERWLTRTSYNEGLSWVTIDSVTQATYTDFYNEEVGYASQHNFTFSGTTRIYRYIGSPLTGLFHQKPFAQASLLIAPNPGTTTSHVTFETKETADYLVLIHDVEGHLMYKCEYPHTTNVEAIIEIATWPAGLYTLTVSSESGMITRVLYKQ